MSRIPEQRWQTGLQADKWGQSPTDGSIDFLPRADTPVD